MMVQRDWKNRILTSGLAAATVTWLPLFILTLVSGEATGDPANRPLLVDLSIEARFLIALPLFMAAGTITRRRLHSVIDYLAESDMLTGKDRNQFETAASDFNHWWDDPTGKISMAVLSVGCSLAMLFALVKGGGTSWFSDGSGALGGVSAAGWWHVTVSLTVWHFVVLRRLWQFVVWWVFLARLGRLDLQLVPTHPDRCGGLGILEMGQLSFAILGTGSAVLLAASVAESLLAGSLAPQAVIPYILIFVLLCVVFVLLPVLRFVPFLVRTKNEGLVVYGDLGESLFRAFGAKWAGLSTKKQAEMLGSVDPSSLADYGYAYEVVDSMRYIVFSRNGFATIAVAALIPFLPLVLIVYSITEVLERLLGLVG